MGRMGFTLFIAILSAALVFASSRTPSIVRAPVAQERDYWPTSGWLKSEPEEQGMNSTLLREMVEYAENNIISLNGIVVVRHGYVVVEEYPNDLYDGTWGHPLYSVTKSFTSALVGLAIREGYIGSVEDRVLAFFPKMTFANMDCRKQAMTLEHVLSMTSGLQWDEWTYPYTDSRNDIRNMTRSSDWVQFVLDRPMISDPGTRWTYNGGGSHLLMAIVYESISADPLAFAQEHLFDPLGITSAHWQQNGAGIPIGFSQLSLRPLDMAKFGYLYLNNGTWDGEQILMQDWVAKSTGSYITLHGNLGYGYQWWVMDQPRGIYDARGMYGQRIIVIPEYDMVVVFVSSGTAREDELLYDFILAAVTDMPPIGEFGSAVASVILLAGTSFTIVFLHQCRKSERTRAMRGECDKDPSLS